MADGTTRIVLHPEKWHHGESNELECLNGCEFLGDGLSDAEALKRAREHVAKTGHAVEQARTIYRYLRFRS